MITISIREMVGPNAISMNSGQKIRDEILRQWDRHEKISLNFDGIDVFASPFFNASVGALLKDRSIEQLQEKLEFVSVSEHGRRLINLVIQNAIKFYSDDGKIDAGLKRAHKDM